VFDYRIVKAGVAEGRSVPVEIAFTPHPSWLPGSGKKLAFTLSIMGGMGRIAWP